MPILHYNTPLRAIQENGHLTAQQIADYDQVRRERRETLTLYHRPLETLKVFVVASLSFIIYSIRIIITHAFMLYGVFPAVVIWIVLEYIPGPYSEAINSIEFCIEFTIWWVGLGVLSSIGLGSGLQSGVLFLFPHIIKVCLAAQTCKTLDFESESDIWFRSPPNLFKCPVLTSSSTPVTLLGTWKKIILVCFLQSAGTALGEIPPYWMTRAARLAAIQSGTSSYNEIPEELETNSKWGIINKAKSWMIWFLRQHGFYGVLFMASYPNIAFDLCGICCGHFLMPFWTFFLATFIGKAIIRNAYQSILYVVLCSEEHMEMFIKMLQYLIPDRLNLDEMIRDAFEEGRESFQNLSKKSLSSDASDIASPSATAGKTTHSAGEIFLFWWQIFMASLLVVFFLSCISHFAQYYQLTVDQEESNKLRKRLLATPSSSTKSASSSSVTSVSGTSRLKASSLLSPGSSSTHITNSVNSNTTSLLLSLSDRDRILTNTSDLLLSKEAQPKNNKEKDLKNSTNSIINESDNKKRE